MRHTQPSLFDQQVYKPGQRVKVEIDGVIEAVRPAGHDNVILSVTCPTGRPGFKQNITYVMAGDPGLTITVQED